MPYAPLFPRKRKERTNLLATCLCWNILFFVLMVAATMCTRVCVWPRADGTTHAMFF